MVPYLLAENPNLSLARAKELSTQMTEGEKWNIVLLNLSFIGWALLAALTAQILGLFLPPIVSGVVGWLLLPYVEATWAELYAVMRAKAIQLGFRTQTSWAVLSVIERLMPHKGYKKRVSFHIASKLGFGAMEKRLSSCSFKSTAA